MGREHEHELDMVRVDVELKGPHGGWDTFTTVRRCQRHPVTDRMQVWVETHDGKIKSRVAILENSGRHHVHAQHRVLQNELVDELRVLEALGVK